MAHSLILLITLLFSNLGLADVVYEKLDEKDYAGRQYVSLSITNGIEDGDFETLKDALNDINHHHYRLKEDSIYLNSYGGLVAEAKLMGHYIRRYHHATKVKKDAQCNSACVFLLISGSCRIADGDVGMHRKRNDEHFKDVSELNAYFNNDQDDEFFKKMGANQELIDIRHNLPHWDLRYLSDSQKFHAGLFNTSEEESQYWQEVVSRKIAAPKSFLLEELEDRNYELYKKVTWYDKWIKKIDPFYVVPSCTEQMFLNLLEKYPVGTDTWDHQFELYDSKQGYDLEDDKGNYLGEYGSEIPLVEGASHFWNILFYKKGVKEITYREETTLAKPTQWENGGESLKVTLNGRRATRTITVPNTGFISNGWGVDPKIDPTGPMSVKVFVDDQLIKEFNYNVISKKQYLQKIKKEMQ